MNIRRIDAVFGALLLLISPSLVFAGNCENIISLGRTLVIKVLREKDFQKEVDNFCKTHKADTNGQSQGSLSLDFLDVLSLNSGRKSSSRSAIYDQYCRETMKQQDLDIAYQEYVEHIAPGTFDAYMACEKSKELGIDLVYSDDVKSQFSVNISYSQTRVGIVEVTLGVDKTKDIQCRWSISAAATKIPAGGNQTLSCTRSDIHKAGYVNVAAKELGPTDSFKLYWAAAPVNVFKWVLVTKEQAPTPVTLVFETNGTQCGDPDYCADDYPLVCSDKTLNTVIYTPGGNSIYHPFGQILNQGSRVKLTENDSTARICGKARCPKTKMAVASDRYVCQKVPTRSDGMTPNSDKKGVPAKQ